MESGSKALRAPDIVKSIRVIVSPLALQTHKFDPVIAHNVVMITASWAPYVKNYGPNIGFDYGNRAAALWLER